MTNDNSTEQLRDVSSLQAYIETGRPLGGFLEAVVSSDLQRAARRADGYNLPRLHLYAAWLDANAPAACFGSAEAYAAWRARGGLKGRESTPPQAFEISEYTGRVDHRSGLTTDQLDRLCDDVLTEIHGYFIDAEDISVFREEDISGPARAVALVWEDVTPQVWERIQMILEQHAVAPSEQRAD